MQLAVWLTRSFGIAMSRRSYVKQFGNDKRSNSLMYRSISTAHKKRQMEITVHVFHVKHSNELVQAEVNSSQIVSNHDERHLEVDLCLINKGYIVGDNSLIGVRVTCTARVWFTGSTPGWQRDTDQLMWRTSRVDRAMSKTGLGKMTVAGMRGAMKMSSIRSFFQWDVWTGIPGSVTHAAAVS